MKNKTIENTDELQKSFKEVERFLSANEDFMFDDQIQKNIRISRTLFEKIVLLRKKTKISITFWINFALIKGLLDSFEKNEIDFCPGLFTSVNFNKSILLNNIFNGTQIPTVSFLDKNSPDFDNKLFNKIKKMRPDLFLDVPKFNKTLGNKDMLLRMALEGKEKPRLRNPKEKKLGAALYRYCHKKNNAFDSIFNQKIRKLRPDWFSKIGLQKVKEIDAHDT